MADRHLIYECPCCNGHFTVVQGKLYPVSTRNGEYSNEYAEVRDDGVIIETHQSAPGRSSGLQVETAVATASQSNARPVARRTGAMQPLGVMSVCRPPKRGSVSRPGLQVTGDDASQDWVPEYEDMSPQERHMDQLLQAQYESDLNHRGFGSTVL